MNLERYSNQIILPKVGKEGQEKLLRASVLIIGAGGLGSPCALYLAAAGIGKIGIVDSDVVEIKNLQRQIIYTTKDADKAKVESAKERIEALNPDVKVIPYRVRVTSKNILDMIRDYDIIIDGSDNFPTKYLVNDACVFSGKPLFHGGISKFEGQTMTIIPGQSACYRCIFPEPPAPAASCHETGILGTVPGVIGTIQANEALKYILNIGTLLTGRLLIFNALDSSFRQVRVPRDPKCPVCGERPTIRGPIEYKERCG